MKVDGIKDIVGVSVVKDVIEKTAGEGPQGDLLFDVVLNSIKEGKYTTDESSEQAVKQSAGYGQILDEIPVIISDNSRRGQVLVSVDMNSEEWKSYTYKSTNTYNSTIDKSNLDSDMSKIYDTVEKYSKKYDVDPNLVLAIIKQESNFDPNASSYAGAKGLMQLMDFNSEAYGITDPYDIDQNIEGGVRHIKSYLDMFDGNVEMALMAYNGGPGNMERRGVNSPSDLYKMPEETQNYVPKVMNYYRNGF